MGSSKKQFNIKEGKKAEEKLKESEVNYKILSNELETILDLNPGILFCKDINDVVTRVNQNFADLLNSKKEDIIGKTTFDLFPKDQAEAFRKDDLEVINTGKPKLNIEELVDFPDKKMWSTTSKVPYYNDKGEINGIIGLAIDITERKKAEQNLEVAREKAESYLDLAGVIILALDKNANIMLLNKKGYEILQYNEGELIGKNWFDICLPEDRKKDTFEIFVTLIRGEIEFVEDVEDKITTKNGEERLVAWHNTLLYDNDGSIIGTLSSGEDITERREAEQKLKASEERLRELNDELENKVLARTEALKRSEEKYKTILDSIVCGVWVADKDDTIHYVNKGMGEIAGIPSEQLVNANVLNDFSESTLKFFRPHYLKAKNTLKKVFYDSVPVITPAGRQSFQSGWLIPLINDDKDYNIICTIDDITERKKTEEKLKESENELRNLNIKLEQKVEERTKELKESEEKYRELLENMMEGYYALDLKGIFTFVNDYWCKTVGYSKEELLGNSYRLIFDEKTSKELFKMFNQLYKSGIPLPHTNRAEGLTNRGKQIYLEGLIDLIYDSEGNKTGFYGFARDITEKKKSEQKLKESEQRLKSFMSSATNGFLLFDAKLNYIDVNNVALQFIGMTKEEVIGKNILDIAPYLKEMGRYDKFLEVIKTGEPFSTDDAILKGTNGRIDTPFSVRAFKVGENLGLIITDITEIKRVELKLREKNIELSVLNKIITLGNESTSLQEFLEKSYDQVLEVVNFDRGGVYLYDHETHHNKLVLHKNTHPDFIAAVEDIDISREPFNMIFDKNKPYYIKDFSEFMEGSKDLGIHSAAIVPLRSKDEYIGSLNVGSHKYQILSQKDLDILVGIGKQMGIIIQKFESEKLLKESEQLLTSFMNSATDGFVLYDARLNYIDVNNVASQIIGMTREEIIGKNILDIVPNLKETGRYDKYSDVIKTGEPFTTEDGIITRRDGQSSSQLSVKAFKVGENLGIIIRDITERKKKEEELRLHSKIMTNMSEGVYLIRLEDLIIVYANPRFEEMFGYEPGEMNGKYVVIVNAPTDKTPEETKEEIVGILKETGEWHGEVNNIKKDGTSFWCYANVSLFDHPEYGKVIVAVHTDITERKEKEKEVFDLAQFPSENPYPVLRVNRSGVMYINEAGKKLLNIEDYSQIPKIFQRDVKEAYESDQNTLLEVELDKRVYSFIITPIKDADYVNIYGMDITEKNQVAVKLRELNKLKTDFLRRASHELKTPLITIKGFSELILSVHKKQLDPSINAKLREINVGCERLQNIIENLLKTSRLESPELRPSKHREDLSFLINVCLHELEPMAERRRQSIILDIHDQLHVTIEKEEIHDVLSNLLSNAIKYTPPMGKIYIRTELKEDFVVVSVRDNGIGFTDEQKKLIFQQFGKIERYGQGLDLGIDGTGLGLYISKKIVESHGGKIWMESEGKNRGSIFYFSLPRIIEE